MNYNHLTPQWFYIHTRKTKTNTYNRLHYISLHYIPFHQITWHYITLHWFLVHYITWLQTWNILVIFPLDGHNPMDFVRDWLPPAALHGGNSWPPQLRRCSGRMPPRGRCRLPGRWCWGDKWMTYMYIYTHIYMYIYTHIHCITLHYNRLDQIRLD